ncbi:hypothetical protein R6Q59_015138 [Mikania micrantha]
MANALAELIFIPAPGLGHIMSTVEIAKILVNRDQRLFVTVLVIKPPTGRYGSAITDYIESLAKTNMNHISFIQLPQHESLSNYDPKSPMSMFSDFIPSHSNRVRNVVADMISQPGSRRIAGFVIDMFCTCMVDVANEFNVPTYMFFTSNAAFLGFKFHVQTLCDDLNEDVVEMCGSNTEILVPSFDKPVPTKVFWSLVHTKEGLDYVLRSVKKLREVKGIMVNTFFELETHAIKSLSADNNIPPVYPVGPILTLERSSSDEKPLDDEVITWLDGQPPSSVVFLCFGSMGSFDEPQVKEIAHGLEQSGQRFLWSLRRPPSNEKIEAPSEYKDPTVVLPKGFMERTNGIGKVIGWAPQLAVLAHRAVGAFVSPCGWNSLLESLWFGVPSVTWPMYAEQQMNAFEMVMELGLAVELRLDYRKDVFVPKGPDPVLVTREEIKNGIKRVMEDNDVRTKVKVMSEKSRLAVMEGGSSYASLGCLVQDFMKNMS